MTTEVELEIIQGEDWTVDIIWTDPYDTGIPVVHPCRLDIKGAGGQTLHTLLTNPELPDGEIPSINLSPNIGLIQLHIENTVTEAFPPGVYRYDLFANVDSDEATFPGAQQHRVISGPVQVIKRVTEL